MVQSPRCRPGIATVPSHIPVLCRASAISRPDVLNQARVVRGIAGGNRRPAGRLQHGGDSPNPGAGADGAVRTARGRRPRPGISPRSGRWPAFQAASKRSHVASISRASAGKGPARLGYRSWRRLPAPDDANRIQLPGHRPPRAVRAFGDLVGGEPFHLPDGDPAQACRRRAGRGAAGTPPPPERRTRGSVPHQRLARSPPRPSPKPQGISAIRPGRVPPPRRRA